MATDAVITLDELMQLLRQRIESLPEHGRVEVAIYKSNNALQNPEVRTFESYKGKITLD